VVSPSPSPSPRRLAPLLISLSLLLSPARAPWQTPRSLLPYTTKQPWLRRRRLQRRQRLFRLRNTRRTAAGVAASAHSDTTTTTTTTMATTMATTMVTRQ
jgi:hypothetical protein